MARLLNEMQHMSLAVKENVGRSGDLERVISNLTQVLTPLDRSAALFSMNWTNLLVVLAITADHLRLDVGGQQLCSPTLRAATFASALLTETLSSPPVEMTISGP
jgi:hypothetical protein